MLGQKLVSIPSRGDDRETRGRLKKERKPLAFQSPRGVAIGKQKLVLLRNGVEVRFNPLAG